MAFEFSDAEIAKLLAAREKATYYNDGRDSTTPRGLVLSDSCLSPQPQGYTPTTTSTSPLQGSFSPHLFWSQSTLKKQLSDQDVGEQHDKHNEAALPIMHQRSKRGVSLSVPPDDANAVKSPVGILKKASSFGGIDPAKPPKRVIFPWVINCKSPIQPTRTPTPTERERGYMIKYFGYARYAGPRELPLGQPHPEVRATASPEVEPVNISVPLVMGNVRTHFPINR